MAIEGTSPGSASALHAAFNPTATAAWTLVGLLTAANMLSFFHRNLVALLAEPIKQEFALSDMELGLLIGLFFSGSYLLAVFPIARLADIGARGKIVGICVIVWSALTSLCLFARSFGMLAAMRMGIGAAEAGLTPTSMSLMADYFGARSLSKATGVYMGGIYLGGGLAMLGGGWLAASISPASSYNFYLLGAVTGWKVIFFLAGLPGIILGLVLLMVKDPRTDRREIASKEPRFSQLREIARSRVHIALISAFAMMIFVGSATAAWIPAFFQRTHGWMPAEIGFRYGAMIGICGTFGAIFGGWLASRLRRTRWPNAHLGIMLGCFLALIPIASLFPLMPTAWGALTLVGAMNLLASATLGIGFSLLQEITEAGMRARVAGINTIAANIIGGTLGPLAVAFLTDHVYASSAALPQAIAATSAVGSIVAFGLLWVAVRMLWAKP